METLKHDSRKSYKEPNRVLSILKIISIVSLLIVLGSLSTIYFSTNNNFFTDFLTIKQESVDSLINTIWAVQTAVVTLTIALMALLVGLNNQKKFGMNALEYIFIIRKGYLKYQDEIILSLLLILIQYFFVAYQALAAVVLIFSVNVIIICHMVYTSIRLTLDNNEIGNEIKTCILEECKSAILKENEVLKNAEREN